MFVEVELYGPGLGKRKSPPKLKTLLDANYVKGVPGTNGMWKPKAELTPEERTQVPFDDFIADNFDLPGGSSQKEIKDLIKLRLSEAAEPEKLESEESDRD